MKYPAHLVRQALQRSGFELKQALRPRRNLPTVSVIRLGGSPLDRLTWALGLRR